MKRERGNQAHDTVRNPRGHRHEIRRLQSRQREFDGAQLALADNLTLQQVLTALTWDENTTFRSAIDGELNARGERVREPDRD